MLTSPTDGIRPVNSVMCPFAPGVPGSPFGPLQPINEANIAIRNRNFRKAPPYFNLFSPRILKALPRFFGSFLARRITSSLSKTRIFVGPDRTIFKTPFSAHWYNVLGLIFSSRHASLRSISFIPFIYHPIPILSILY